MQGILPYSGCMQVARQHAASATITSAWRRLGASGLDAPHVRNGPCRPSWLVASQAPCSVQRRNLSAQTAAQLDAEIKEFAQMPPHPVTVNDLLTCLEPWRAAKFVHQEMPIRFAERMRWIEGIPEWRDIFELQHVHGLHRKAFRMLRQVKRHPTLDEFTDACKEIVDEQQEVVRLMSAAMYKLQDLGPHYGPEFVDEFLDGFLLNRFGSNVLMTQFLALSDDKYGEHGIIDPNCDAAEVCREAASEVLDVCERHTAHRPTVVVKTYSSAGTDHGIPKFAYIPGALKYIMHELLKNSCRATVEFAEKDIERGAFFSHSEALAARPINVVVCADEQNVAICTSDRAGGIPFEVGSRVWSYLYTTARKDGRTRASELAGYGVGLPLSRLYARYLGGSLDLVSLPGYGTHAYLFLPRLAGEQVEVVPDKDSSFGYHTIVDYTL